MTVPVGLGHGFDGTRARGRHDDWHTDVCGCARGCKLVILVQDTLYSDGSHEYGRGQLDAEKDGLGVGGGVGPVGRKGERPLCQGYVWVIASRSIRYGV